MSNFILKCNKCNWHRFSNGRTDELSDLKEVVRCTKCGRPREFKCPGCGNDIKMIRVKK